MALVDLCSGLFMVPFFVLTWDLLPIPNVFFFFLRKLQKAAVVDLRSKFCVVLNTYLLTQNSFCLRIHDYSSKQNEN